MWNTGELGLRDVVFNGINHGGECEDTHGDKKEETSHLLVALPQREAKRYEPRRVTRQFQNTKNTHESQHLSYLAYLTNSLHVSGLCPKIEGLKVFEHELEKLW